MTIQVSVTYAEVQNHCSYTVLCDCGQVPLEGLMECMGDSMDLDVKGNWTFDFPAEMAHSSSELSMPGSQLHGNPVTL